MEALLPDNEASEEDDEETKDGENVVGEVSLRGVMDAR